jgi:hypothetical protein
MTSREKETTNPTGKPPNLMLMNEFIDVMPKDYLEVIAIHDFHH